MVSASTSAEGSGAPSAHGMGARQPTEGLFRRAAPRLSRGELGTLPVVTALVIIAVFFQLENSNFLSTRNLYYLTLQFASLSMYALGAMLVLLIAEIDLSSLGLLNIGNDSLPQRDSWHEKGTSDLVGLSLHQRPVFERLVT